MPPRLSNGDRERAQPAGSNWKALQKTLRPGPASASSSGTAPVSKTQERKARYKAFKRQEELREMLEQHKQTGTGVHQSLGLSKGKEKASQLDAPASATSSKTGSPAPTSLPWFAEDLSPEDLALVRQIQEGGNAHMSLGAASAMSGTSDGQQMSAEKAKEAALKKRVILGGWDDSASEDKKAPGSYLAIDCEMVGVGPRGSQSALARVSIVNFHGFTILDTFVRPREKVTDYRTWVSGVRAADLKHAPAFGDVRKQVEELVAGKTLVGHALQNDLSALHLTHPRYLIRDTATFVPLAQLAGTKKPSLRALVRATLGIEIQLDGQEHSSVEDARATMAVFRTQKAQWDAMLRKGGSLYEEALAEAGASKAESSHASAGAKRKDNASDPAAAARKPKRSVPSQPDWWKAPA